MTQPYTPPTTELPPEIRTAEQILIDLVGKEAWDLIAPAAQPASDEA